MNYYPLNIGDYAAHTGHLEPMEDLIYRRLLDAYYLREGPLPADHVATAKLIRLRSIADDVLAVLKEFFELTEDGWRHSRCDSEIEKMLDKQAKARASARASVNARMNSRQTSAERPLTKVSTNAQRTLPVSSTDVELPTPTPTPVDISLGVSAKPAASRASKKCPADFQVTQELKTWANEKTPGLDLAYETEKFRDHTFATPRADWAATWRAWMRKSFELRGGMPKTSGEQYV